MTYRETTREECTTCERSVSVAWAFCPWCGVRRREPFLLARLQDDEAATDGVNLRGVTPADDLERHLQRVLDEADDPDARRHAREGLQYLHVLDEADGRGSA